MLFFGFNFLFQALVIGNADYKFVPSLSNPVHDAEDVAAALSNLNYEVIVLTNASYKAMLDAVQQLVGVRNQVMLETKDVDVQQVPWDSSSLRHKFCFGECRSVDKQEVKPSLEPVILEFKAQLKAKLRFGFQFVEIYSLL